MTCSSIQYSRNLYLRVRRTLLFSFLVPLVIAATGVSIDNYSGGTLQQTSLLETRSQGGGRTYEDKAQLVKQGGLGTTLTSAIGTVAVSENWPHAQSFHSLRDFARQKGFTSGKTLRKLDAEKPPPARWEAIYVGCVLLLLFILLLWDRVGADWVLVISLTLCMASNIISVKEGLAGFASEGIWTVMVLFVVAAGISNTGALDWYMTILLGKPRNVADAQLRIFIPVTIVSAFLNNTPIVVIMIPVVQRWCRNIGMDVGQLMLPMCYGVVLGGTCTFIGSSTNLVALGLLGEADPAEAAKTSIFSLGAYGVPIALAGEAYMFLFSWLLPGASKSASRQSADDDPILLGARLTKWSSAAGRTVKRSGLRDTGGIYLVSVHRATTGNIHRAVGQEFVLNVDDILYFAGLVEEFPKFCDEHGLEVVTAEDNSMRDASKSTPSPAGPIGSSMESLASADSALRMRIIFRMIDLIHGKPPAPDESDEVGLAGDIDPAQILVSYDSASHDNDLVIIGVNSRDRPGLLHDVSKCLVRMSLQCHRTEAAVVGLRSFSVWRCERLKVAGNDLEEIWESLKELLGSEAGFKQKGMSIVRATVTSQSRLIGSTVRESRFRDTYKAAIVAVQRGGKNITERISKTRFDEGDVLFLQVSSDSFLLVQPEADFYTNLNESSHSKRSSVRGSVSNLVKSFRHQEAQSSGAHDVELADLSETEIPDYGSVNDREAVWRDLQVAFSPDEDKGASREYLTAMKVPGASSLAKKSALDSGLDKLPGIVLVSIERPVQSPDVRVLGETDAASVSTYADNSTDEKVESIPFDEPLAMGDILWFAGSVSDVAGSLRKIPGLVSYESEQVGKIKGKVHDRRLVQAVIAKQSPLVGKTPMEAAFRTRYGAAVIAVNRGGKRLYEYPGRVKLRAGDVLLLEAGSAFVKKNTDSDKSFSLLAEVENSSPPRLRMLIPALVLTVAMLAVATAGFCSLLVSALFAAILMVAFGILSQQQAREAMNWFVFVTVGSSFGIGTAMENSGFSHIVAKCFVSIGSAIGLADAGIFGAIYIGTGLISNVVTNNAAAALMFPIAYETAVLSGTDPVLMTYCVIFGASACYMSPFGYQCNLLVYGPGGYKTVDYIRFGTPLQIFLWLFSTLVLSLDTAWYWAWVWTGACFVIIAVAAIFGCPSLLKTCSKRGEHSHS